jgi:hypothetical protein
MAPTGGPLRDRSFESPVPGPVHGSHSRPTSLLLASRKPARPPLAGSGEVASRPAAGQLTSLRARRPCDPSPSALPSEKYQTDIFAKIKKINKLTSAFRHYRSIQHVKFGNKEIDHMQDSASEKYHTASI